MQRAAIPRHRRRPAFLVLDEAQQYIDRSINKFLAMARKFNVGLIAAHQDLSQLSPGLAAALTSRTSIKLAGGISDRDAHTLARDLRTTPDQLLSLERGERATQFAAYISGITPSAVPITIPFGTLEAMPRMTTAQHQKLIALNRSRIATKRKTTSPPTSPVRGAPPRPANPTPTKTGKGRPAPTIPRRDDDWWS